MIVRIKPAFGYIPSQKYISKNDSTPLDFSFDIFLKIKMHHQKTILIFHMKDKMVIIVKTYLNIVNSFKKPQKMYKYLISNTTKYLSSILMIFMWQKSVNR